MANLFFHGFEGLTNTYLKKVWDITNYSGGNIGTGGSSPPRSGGSGQCLFGGLGPGGTKSLGGNYSHLFGGSARAYRFSVDATTLVLFGFRDGTTVQCGWYTTAAGEIVVVRGNETVASATELGRTATGIITSPGSTITGADYKMIEMEVVFATSATGSVKIRVGDIEVLSLSSVQTAASANAYANRVFFNHTGNTYHDDIYVNDNSGSSPENSYLGEAFVVEASAPNGNGNSSQWVGSDGNSTDNYLLVDDTGNDDTDYVKSGTLNDLDTYTMSDLVNASGTVIGVNHYFVARKDDVAGRTVASALRTASTDYIGSNKTMAGSYDLFHEDRLVNPNTSSRFTISDVNGLEIGTKVTT